MSQEPELLTGVSTNSQGPPGHGTLALSSRKVQLFYHHIQNFCAMRVCRSRIDGPKMNREGENFPVPVSWSSLLCGSSQQQRVLPN